MYILAENPPLSDEYEERAPNVEESSKKSAKFWNFEDSSSVCTSDEVSGLVVRPKFFNEKEVRCLVDCKYHATRLTFHTSCFEMVGPWLGTRPRKTTDRAKKISPKIQNW